ncbi:MAG TPA: fatty acid oxidation complex subunit alpha FadB, partial [Candidatus Lambdaproteobacteria bacterium]|nr:fatty acid oxidation complex subunit alpha FadB [Candidatus Lambdaproteobacteria bacterium]
MKFKGKAIQCRKLENNIVELIFDAQGESVNKFDQTSLEELREVVKQLAAENSVSGLLVTSAKDVFIVGADITEFIKGFQVPLDELVQWVKDAQKIFSDL